MSRPAKIALVCAILAVMIVAGVWLPVGAWLRTLVEWTRDLGPLGVVVFSFAFVLVCVLLVPSMPMYIAAGFLYGTWWGALLVTLLGVVVELVTLWLVHTRLRKHIEQRIHEHPRLAALDRGIARHPFWIVQLLRVSPLMPFGPLNYALALTKIPLWQRIITNVIGMGLCSIPQTYLGSLLSHVHQIGDADPPPVWKYVALVVGLATLAGAAALTAWATKRAGDGEEAA